MAESGWVCHFCDLPIPHDEAAVEATTGNAWAHFECWYDGAPINRNPMTGEREPLTSRIW